jgi:hypothetical protein
LRAAHHVHESGEPSRGSRDNLEEHLACELLSDCYVQRDGGHSGEVVVLLVINGLNTTSSLSLLSHLALDSGTLRGIESREVTWVDNEKGVSRSFDGKEGWRRKKVP